MTRTELQAQLQRLDKEDEIFDTLRALRIFVENDKALFGGLSGMTYYDGIIAAIEVMLGEASYKDLL